MNNIKKYIMLLMAMAVINSCNQEEFLTSQYYGGVVDQNFLTTPSHAKPAVTGVYDVLSYMGVNWNRLILGSSGADDIVEQHGDALWASLIAIDQYRWTAEEFGDPKHFWKHWTALYAGVQRANLVLDKMPPLEGLGKDLKKRYIAEVKALRAFYYYYLVTAHGDVPLILEPIGYEGAINLTRSPEAEVWAQIITDLTEAASDLPDSYDSDNRGRVTKGMAFGLLSQVYLWEDDWAKAEEAARKVVNSPAGYQLEPNYVDLFNGVSENSDEAVFTIMKASGSETQNIWSDYLNEGNQVIYWGPFQPWSWFYQPDTNFVRHNTYTDESDVRIDVITFDGNSETIDLNNDGSIDSLDLVPSSPPGNIHLMKWVPTGVDLTAGSIWEGGQGYVDRHVIRLAEVYLDLAEALVQQGRGAEALEFINLVRQRAQASDITATDKNTLLDIILNERKVEFCFEGKRFFDLKRAGKLKDVLGPLGWQDHMVNYPIPQEEIDLTKMSQNAGY